MSDEPLTIEKMRAAIRQLGEPVPDFIVTVFAVPGKPIEYRGHLYLSPEDAKTLHAKTPLILRQILSPTSGRYGIASPFDGPFPIDLPVPPFDRERSP